jgi:pyruvate dehydrogenase (quinone)
VICLAGDGGFAMLLGDLLTTVQEDLPTGLDVAKHPDCRCPVVRREQRILGRVPVDDLG